MEFVFVSGRPCLDFVATRQWRRRSEPTELLTTPAGLTRWIARAGLVDRPPAVDASSLAGAVVLREALYRVLDARRRGVRPRRPDVATVNEAAAGPGVVRRLSGTGAVRTTGDVPQVLSRLVADALDLMGDADAVVRLRECADPECTRLFVDTSRGQTRRWCGMSDCGNRAKVARFRGRQASDGS